MKNYQSRLRTLLSRVRLLLIVVFIVVSGLNLPRNRALALASAIERVSTDSSNNESDDNSYTEVDLSSDGQYVVFSSDATNLVGSDTNSSTDVFVKDRQSGTTTRVSTDSSGTQGNAASYADGISNDGRYVVFESLATNLVGSDTNAVNDIFVKDRQTGTTTRVSTDSSGTQANNASIFGAISDDGQFVAFRSGATNLVGSDTNGVDDIFLKDRQTGTTTRVSTDSSGTQSNALSDRPSISDDGQFVTFSSNATNLVGSDTNGGSDIFVKDTQSGTTTRVSTDSSGTQADDASDLPVISGDGRYVVFMSYATNLVASDTNSEDDVFRKDTQSGTTTRVSTDSSGTQASGSVGSDVGDISDDGRYIVFSSTASNLVAGDTNGNYDIFLKDIQSGTMERLSTDASDTEANGDSYPGGISADGQFVGFISSASNLVAGDTNTVDDAFVKDTSSIMGGGGGGGDGRSLTISDSGTSATNVTYEFRFTPSSSTPLQSIRFYFCTTPLGSCTKPAGLDVSGYTLGTQTFTQATSFTSQNSNENQCTVATGSNDENEICLERTETNPEAADTKLVIFNNITNPSVTGTVYVRLTLYDDNDFASGNKVFEGAVAAAIVNTLTIQARVQENLVFCVGTTSVDDASTSPGADCAAISGTTVDLGIVDTSTTGAVSPDSDGNNVNGIAFLRTNANGGTLIGYRAVSQSGTNHQTALRVTGASCNAGNVNNDQCFRSYATEQQLAAGSEQFGMTVRYVNTGSGGSTTAISRAANYDYDTADEYAWQEDNTATEPVATASGAVDDEALILKFAAVAAITTPTGSYQAQAKFIVTPTF